MGLTTGQIPKVANDPIGGVAVLSGSTTVVTVGNNTNGSTILTAGASGARVTSLVGVSTDSANVAVHIYILSASVVLPLGSANLPSGSGAGSGSIFNVDFLDGSNIAGLPIDNNGKRYIPLSPLNSLRCGSLVTTTNSGSKVWVSGNGANYQ